MMGSRQSRDDLTLHAWCLVVYGGSDTVGLTPLRQSEFHQIIYLASTLCSLWHQGGPYHLVMKDRNGPYYPDAQWQTERLCAQGMIKPVGTSLASEGEGDELIWLSTSYCLLQSGYDLLTELRSLRYWDARYLAVKDICFAFIESQANREGVATVTEDDTFAQPGVPDQAIIRFSATESNRTIERVRTLRQLIPKALSVDERDLARAYAQLLKIRIERRNQGSVQ